MRQPRCPDSQGIGCCHSHQANCLPSLHQVSWSHYLRNCTISLGFSAMNFLSLSSRGRSGFGHQGKYLFGNPTGLDSLRGVDFRGYPLVSVQTLKLHGKTTLYSYVFQEYTQIQKEFGPWGFQRSQKSVTLSQSVTISRALQFVSDIHI